MSEQVTYDQWKVKLAPVVQIKVDEFELLGYGEADPEQIWHCAVHRVNREYKEESVAFHRFVNELLGLSVNDYMNRLRMESFQGPDWLSGDQPLNLDEFDEPST